MRKEPQTFLECYEKWMEDNETLPYRGLCESLPFNLNVNEAFTLMCPTQEDKNNLIYERKNFLYWGSDSWVPNRHRFTPLRQTIILLAAALNDEL